MLKNKKVISIILLILLFCILAIVVKTKNNLVIDEKIYSVISMLHSDVATVFFKSVTILGNAKIIGLICIILLLPKKTRYIVGMPITIVTFVSGIVNILLKNVFERQRPILEQLVNEDSFSFPSGHSMVTAAIYSMIIYLSSKYIKNNKIKNIVNIVSCVIIFLVGISRIYLRVHYFSDVIAGWLLGIVIVSIYSVIEDRIKKVR